MHAGTSPVLDDLEGHRRELTGYCYRMLGSGADAEDAVQETMLRAWRAADRFEGRSAVRSWLYRIATNICLDMHRSRARRAQPMDLGPPSEPREGNLGPMLPESRWISPVADDRVLDGHDPAEVAVARESIRLAFVAALQHLPPRQRAALILCDVLHWPAAEAATLLTTTTASVTSALQRARATMARRHGPAPGGARPADGAPDSGRAVDEAVLARYVDAFERFDIPRLVSLLREDAVMSMPPFAMWIVGAEAIGEWMVQPGPRECAGSQLVPVRANGGPAFGQYRRAAGGGRRAWALLVLEVADGRIVGQHAFLDVERIFPAFGLPLQLDPPGRRAPGPV